MRKGVGLWGLFVPYGDLRLANEQAVVFGRDNLIFNLLLKILVVIERFVPGLGRNSFTPGRETKEDNELRTVTVNHGG